MEKIKKILFLVQLPPPIHGVSMVNNFVVSNPYFDKFEKKIIKLNFAKTISDLKKLTFAKFIKSISIFFKIFFSMLFFKPQIVYFTLFPFGKAFFYRDIFYLTLIKIFNKKIVFHFHNIGINNESKNKFKQRIYNWAFSNLNIIFLSEKIKENETVNLSLKNTSFFIVKNGISKIDIEKYYSSKNNDVFNILFFSNFFEEKGIFFVLDAFLKLSEKHSDIHLTMAGQDYNNNLKRIIDFIKNHKLENKITIKENVFNDEKYRLFGESDIFVFPSYFKETSSLVVLEAMQFGIPIVASATGVIPELLIDNKTALLFPPKNTPVFIEKLTKVILDADLRKNISNNAKEYFLNNYTVQFFWNSMSNVFNKVINE